MNRQEKIEEVKRIEKDLEESEASFIFDFRGLKVAELTEFRKRLRKAGARFHVVKNNLARRAIEKAGPESLSQFFFGCTGVIFVKKDPLASAKVVKEFIVNHPNLAIKGGILGGDVLDDNKIKSLGDIPSREILLSQLLAGIQFPVRRLVGVLNSPLSSLIFLLNSILSKKKET